MYNLKMVNIDGRNR